MHTQPIFFEIDESAVSSSMQLPEGLSLVNPSGTCVDISGLERSLRNNPTVVGVKSICLRETSMLKTLMPFRVLSEVRELRISSRQFVEYHDIALFPNLQQLVIDVPLGPTLLPNLLKTKIDSLGITVKSGIELSHLGRMAQLRSLVLVKWPEKDFSAIRDLCLEKLIIKTGQIRTVAGLNSSCLKVFKCAECSELESLSELDSEQIDIDACRKLRCETISGLRIKSVALRRMVGVSNLAFLLNCPNVQEVVVTATRLSKDALDSLQTHERLNRVQVFGSGLTANDLKRFSQSLKSALVTDGLSTFRGGVQV